MFWWFCLIQHHLSPCCVNLLMEVRRSVRVKGNICRTGEPGHEMENLWVILMYFSVYIPFWRQRYFLCFSCREDSHSPMTLPQPYRTRQYHHLWLVSCPALVGGGGGDIGIVSNDSISVCRFFSPYNMAPNRMIGPASLSPYIPSPMSTYQVGVETVTESGGYVIVHTLVLSVKLFLQLHNPSWIHHQSYIMPPTVSVVSLKAAAWTFAQFYSVWLCPWHEMLTVFLHLFCCYFCREPSSRQGWSTRCPSSHPPW